MLGAPQVADAQLGKPPLATVLLYLWQILRIPNNSARQDLNDVQQDCLQSRKHSAWAFANGVLLVFSLCLACLSLPD